MRSYLEENNIYGEYRNEFSSSVMGEVAFFDVWPELWVCDTDYHCAVELLEQIQQKKTNGGDWFCHSCKEQNPATFELCWQCGKVV